MLQNKKFTLKKIIFACFLSAALIFAPVQTHQADALWGEVLNASLTTILQYIQNMIQGMMMGMMKQMATQMLNQDMGNMIGGSSTSNAKFITNWQDFMFTQPKQEADNYMNDYLSQLTKGRGSITGYIPNNNLGSSGLLSDNYEGVGNGSFNYGMSQDDPEYASLIATAEAKGINLGGVNTGNAGNYMQQLVQGAKNSISDSTMPTPTYQGNPAQNLFSDGTFKNLNTYLSGINNPWAFNMNAEQKYQEQLTQNQQAAQAQAVAYQGFKGTSSGGTITNPGSLIKENMANVQDMGNKVLASANSMPEIITSVIQQIVTQSIQSGIGNAAANAQREVQNVQNQTAQQVQQQVQQNGPGAMFGNGSTGQ